MLIYSDTICVVDLCISFFRGKSAYTNAFPQSLNMHPNHIPITAFLIFQNPLCFSFCVCGNHFLLFGILHISSFVCLLCLIFHPKLQVLGIQSFHPPHQRRKTVKFVCAGSLRSTRKLPMYLYNVVTNNKTKYIHYENVHL